MPIGGGAGAGEAGTDLRKLASPLGRVWLRARERLMRRLSDLRRRELDLSWITDHLAVGGAFDPDAVGRLARLGIRAVVDVRLEASDDPHLLGRHGIALLHLPTPDGHEFGQDDLRRGVDWIRARLAEGKKVLIHCAGGAGRSPLLACAVLVSQGYSAPQALELVRARRWQASPNDRQLEALLAFERQRSA